MAAERTRPFEKVAVIGLGYVGLPMAAVVASRGIRVVGVDIDERAVKTINGGKAHIVEPDLDILVNAAVTTGMLRAVTEIEPADAFVIAVPTPFREDHKPDLRHIEAATRKIAPVLKRGDLVVVESTSPVGTTEQVARWLADARPDLRFPPNAGADADIYLAHSPERVLPGRVLLELVRNDRVIGGLTPACAARAALLYRNFVSGECVLTDARTAELVKLAENSFRDVNIAFANEIATVCSRLDIDVWRVIELANRHPRVHILKPGPGVGGHCIAVDPWFIVDSAPEDTPLIRAARGVNDSMPDRVAASVREAAGGPKTPVACLGLSYKADIDDLRESPAVEVVARLAADTQRPVLVVEPHIARLPARLSGMGNIRLVSLETALDGAAVVVLLVDHRAFREMDPGHMQDKALIDTRGLWRR